jgi:hypothetical protein
MTEMVAPTSLRSNPNATIDRLRDFLIASIRHFAPDLIVLTERKGTAAYRAVAESHTTPSDVLPPWSKVVSSESLAAYPDKLLRNARILVFDDMMRHGISVSAILEHLLARRATDTRLSNVYVAAFAVHEDGGMGHSFYDAEFPDAAYMRHLPPSAYRAVRTALVVALQQSGSLMLDTEHVELRLQLRAPLTRLAKALGRTGEVVAFRSAGGRTNLTVFYSDDTIRTSEEKALPPATRNLGVVRKARVVERLPGEFALIPMCLPDATRAIPDEWRAEPIDRGILGPGLLAHLDDRGRFYHVALRASLEPLFLAIKDIYAAPDVCEVHLPSIDASDSGGPSYDLRHLVAMYPRLAIVQLYDRLLATFADAKQAGQRVSGRRSPEGPGFTEPHDLRDAARALLQRIGDATDRRAAEALVDDGIALGDFVSGVTHPDVLQLGASAGLSPAIVSACMDILIDEALLVTRVEAVGEGVKRHWMGRTYLPDGEVASEALRDYTRRHGLIRDPIPA